jgi:hypothetical protein
MQAIPSLHLGFDQDMLILTTKQQLSELSTTPHQYLKVGGPMTL